MYARQMRTVLTKEASGKSEMVSWLREVQAERWRKRDLISPEIE